MRRILAALVAMLSVSCLSTAQATTIYYNTDTVTTLADLYAHLGVSEGGDCTTATTTTCAYAQDTNLGNPESNLLSTRPAQGSPLSAATFSAYGLPNQQGYGWSNTNGTLGINTDFNGTYGIVIAPKAVTGGRHGWLIPQSKHDSVLWAGTGHYPFQEGSTYQQFVGWTHNYQSTPCSAGTGQFLKCGTQAYMTAYFKNASGQSIGFEFLMWQSFYDSSIPWAANNKDFVLDIGWIQFLGARVGDSSYTTSCGTNSFSVGGSGGESGSYCVTMTAAQFQAAIQHINAETNKNLDTDPTHWEFVGVNLDAEVFSDGTYNPAIGLTFNNHYALSTGAPPSSPVLAYEYTQTVVSPETFLMTLGPIDGQGVWDLWTQPFKAWTAQVSGTHPVYQCQHDGGGINDWDFYLSLSSSCEGAGHLYGTNPWAYLHDTATQDAPRLVKRCHWASANPGPSHLIVTDLTVGSVCDGTYWVVDGNLGYGANP